MLEKSGIPLYEELKFTNGSLSGGMGMRFATSDSVANVRQWYQYKFPNWALNADYGAWILYKGKPGAGPTEYLTRKQISVIKQHLFCNFQFTPSG